MIPPSPAILLSPNRQSAFAKATADKSAFGNWKSAILMIFPSIRIEGQVFSGELLEKLDQPETAGQRPSDFGLLPDTKVKDEIVRAWAASQSFYRAFRQKTGNSEWRVASGEWKPARLPIHGVVILNGRLP